MINRRIINISVLKDFLTFSRGEQRGIAVLLTLLMLLFILRIIFPVFVKDKDFDAGPSEKMIIEFEKQLAKADSEEKAKRNSSRYSKTGFGSVYDTLKKFPEENFIIELNTADTLDLQRLKGIGPGFARRIIKYRDRLGGYHDVNQVMEVFGMEKERFDAIRDHLTADPALIKPLDINNAAFKALLAHPYFPFEITKQIMIYKKEHKVIKEVEELKSIKGIDEQTYGKIRPYVTVKQTD